MTDHRSAVRPQLRRHRLPRRRRAACSSAASGCTAADGRTFATVNPATESALVQVAQAGAGGRRPRRHGGPRAPSSPGRRGAAPRRATAARLLWRMADLLERDADVLAQLESLDNGKLVAGGPRRRRRHRGGAVPLLRRLGDEDRGHDDPDVDDDRQYHAYTRREPVGVVAGIVPWNFPLLMACFKIVPALTAGNTVILKPAEQTPLTALCASASCSSRPGFPPGVVERPARLRRRRCGAGRATPASTRWRSPARPRWARRSSPRPPGNLKKVSLELGGKAPNIVFADADLERAVAGAALGGLLQRGPVLRQRLAALRGARRVRRGGRRASPTPPAPSGWAARSTTRRWARSSREEQHEKVLGYVRAGLDGRRGRGHGRRRAGPRGRGYFVRADRAHRRHRGHVGAARGDLRAGRDGGAVRHRRGGRGGREQHPLRPGRRRLDRATSAGRTGSPAALRAGTVWVNSWHADDVTLPRGGFKESGWGRELGSFGLDDFTELKTVIVDIG